MLKLKLKKGTAENQVNRQIPIKNCTRKLTNSILFLDLNVKGEVYFLVNVKDQYHHFS